LQQSGHKWDTSLILLGEMAAEGADLELGADVAVSTINRDAEGAGQRLRKAVAQFRSVKAAAAAAAVPAGTLKRYLAGAPMKLETAAALAAATGVRLEWLATGTGPMRADAPENPQPAAPQREVRMFRDLHMDTLADAFAAALQALAARGQANPDPRRVMQITAILYDQLREGVELGSYSSDPPNKD
jgi:hypothetical protein